jgi:hypothetical protein
VFGSGTQTTTTQRPTPQITTTRRLPSGNRPANGQDPLNVFGGSGTQTTTQRPVPQTTRPVVTTTTPKPTT